MRTASLPKKYHDACDRQPKEYSDYESYQPAFGFPDDYEVSKKIGRGKYSDVFEGFDSRNDQRIVIKVLKPGKKKREGSSSFERVVKKVKIKREIKILRILSDCPNTIKLLDTVIDPASRTPSLVFPHFYSRSHLFVQISNVFLCLE